MDIETQVREGVRLLNGIEMGSLESPECFNIIDRLDPALISLSVKLLRKKYPSTHQDSAGVMGRLVEITSNYPQVVNKIKEGDQDPIAEWFEDTYSYRDYFQVPEDFIRLVVDKLES